MSGSRRAGMGIWPDLSKMVQFCLSLSKAFPCGKICGMIGTRKWERGNRMEEDILRAVGRIAGRQYRECYRDLCAMVEAAIPCMPGDLCAGGSLPGSPGGRRQAAGGAGQICFPGGRGHLGKRRPGGAAEAAEPHAPLQARAEGADPGAGPVGVAGAQSLRGSGCTTSWWRAVIPAGSASWAGARRPACWCCCSAIQTGRRRSPW